MYGLPGAEYSPKPLPRENDNMEKNFDIYVGGERIVATVHGKPGPERNAVITCHGMLASRMSTKAILLGRAVEKMGHFLVRFDFRGCGQSDGTLEDSMSSQRAEDLDAVIAHVKKTWGVNRIGLFGSSLGGYVALVRGGTSRDIATVISVSTPFSMATLLDQERNIMGEIEIDGYVFPETYLLDARRFDERMKRALAKTHHPTLFVHGNADTLVPPDHARELYRNVKRNGEKNKLVIVEGADHSYSQPQHLELLLEHSTKWLKTHLC